MFLIGPGVPVGVRKGFFDKEPGEGWTTREEFDRMVAEARKRGKGF